LNFAACDIYDVAVIGTGPAGCSAATALARQGLTVLLLEKSALPRYKTCGGGLLRRAWQMLPSPPAALVESSFNSVVLNFHGEGLQFTATRPEPLVRMTMRADLDHYLATEAKNAGVILLDGCAVRQVSPAPDKVELTTERGVFKARFLIAADGVHSMTAKACGWLPLPQLAPAIEWELSLPSEEFARHGQIARFDFGFIDAGYAWVFPKRNHLSVGILTTRPANIHLAAKLETYLQSLGINRIDRIEKHGYVIPLEPRREPLVRGRVLLVGDAAGLVDPITAEGISHALGSGRLAAEAIGASPADVAAVGRRYQALLEKNILADLRAGRWLAKFVYHRTRIRHWAFRCQGPRLTNFVTDVVMGERGYQAALQDPRNYLKMLRFWRP
jgi:geranylgeranyl reductase family protein